jgi:hypothetical protein
MDRRRLVVPIVATVISYAAALLLTLGVQSWAWPSARIYLLGLLGVIAAAVSAAFAEYLHEKRLEDKVDAVRTDLEMDRAEHGKTNKEFCEDNIREMLHQAAITIAPDAVGYVRANVFLPEGSGDRLFVAYHYGMDGSPDLGVRLEPRAGCAGHAWTLADVAIADLADSADEQLRRIWKLSREQIALTNHLRAIISVPILHPKDPGKVVGVFNLDSTEPIAGVFTDIDAKEYLIRMAALLAAFLWLGEIVSRSA